MVRMVALVMLVFSFLASLGQGTVVRNVNVIDVKTGGLVPNQAVVIANGKISWIGPDKKVAVSNETSVNGEGKYLMPGLIDSHIHFFQSGSLYTRPDAIDLRSKVSYEKERQQGWNNTPDYLKRYIRLGITTVIDVGGPFSNFAIRDSVSKHTLSPNVLVTGPLFSIVAVPELGKKDQPIIKITSNASVDSLFQKMLPYKPDFIKVWYIVDDAHPAEKSFPLVKYIGQLCARNHLKLAVHATELKAARLAVEAGASILVHSVEDQVIPDDFVKTLKSKKVTYIPTLIVNQGYFKTFAGIIPYYPQDLLWANAFAYGTLSDVEGMKEEELPAVLKKWRKNGIPPSFKKYDSIPKVNLRKLMKAGVAIATGTDAGNIGTFHASSYLTELQEMRKAGLTNAQILTCSTINPAIGFGIADRTGSIDAGKNADLLLLSRNPLENIDNLNSIEAIFKDGEMISPEGIIQESPEAIVQRQLNAYNGRNLDLFLATYSPDVEIYEKGKLTMKGQERMRAEYEPLFKDATNLYCHIDQRIVIKNKVIDKETVRAGERTLHAVAIYEVENGKIKKVTFLE